MTPTKILLTGATGFIGTRLCERLKLHWRLPYRALVRNYTHATRIARLDSEMIPGDLTNVDALVKALGATKTPQAFLLGPDGKPRYQGRINNLYADYGQRRQSVTQHDLRHALDAVLAGKPVSQPVTEVIGCHIQTTSETKQP